MERLKSFTGIIFLIIGIAGLGGYCDLGTGLVPSLVLFLLGVILLKERVLEELTRENEDDYSYVLGIDDDDDDDNAAAC